MTPRQIEAVRAEGNVLALAGAGTGKTKTLVQRCVARLLDLRKPASIDQILMVTFTEAAAAEMKQRIREALELEYAAASADTLRRRLEEQMALLATAHIGTLHSFCLKLVRQHFHQLELDPRLSVLEESAARLMMEETLDELLEQALRDDARARDLAETQGGEHWLRRMIAQLHHYTQTLADPEGWFAMQFAQTPAHWERWLAQGFEDWKTYWLPVLEAEPRENLQAHVCKLYLKKYTGALTRAEMTACLGQILEQEWPRGTMKYKKAVAGFYDGAEFLHALCGDGALGEDWSWTRGHMEALFALAQEFAAAYAARKRDEGVLDFHDFEQFTLRLLWDRRKNQPTELARRWRQQLRYVFVDECQDINAAQDAILRALSDQNLFLVGDVKQSIYRFRLADPRIFQEYKARWERDPALGTVIPLADNFRSRQTLLDFINPVFTDLMGLGVGGVSYGTDAQLIFGSPLERPVLPPEASVEAHFLIEGGELEEEGDSSVAELTRPEKEAAMVGRRLRQLKELPLMVQDGKGMRPVQWKDMVVLMRSPAGKAETYAKEFFRCNIPFQAEQGDFYECAEISDLLSLLQVLDNPLQDVPLLAVLRSPLVGLSLDELAEIRLANPKGQFWKALARWHEIHVGDSKVSTFLKRFSRWRQIARETSLSQRLDIILNETAYRDWLRLQSRPGQRLANVRRFLTLAQRFDPFQRHGLKRFLRFVETHREADVNSEPLPTDNADAVRLMSIHKSKGLEFPVVIVADLAKRFNLSDATGRVLLDEVYGVCPQVKPPRATATYPSLPHWLASQRKRREAVGEELRLLYVAMTRAKDRLLLTGAVPARTAEKWQPATPSVHKLLSARSYIDWLGPWLAGCAGEPEWLNQPRGTCRLFEWFCHPGAPDRAELPAKTDTPNAPARVTLTDTPKLSPRLQWTYPHAAATREIATQRVTALRARLEEDDVASAQPPARSKSTKPKLGISALQVGNAHHQFLQLMRFDDAWTEPALRKQAEAMLEAGYLSLEQLDALDFKNLLAFWTSDFGRDLLAHGKHLHREIPFTVRMSPLEVKAPNLSESEFIVVRGAVDLALILEKEIRVLDFKTDALTDSDLPEAIRIYTPQVQLYGLALARIYQRPASMYLHFVSLNRTVPIPPHQTCTESAEKIFSSKGP